MDEIYKEIEKLNTVFLIFKLMEKYKIPEKHQAFVLAGSMEQLGLNKR